MQQMEKKDHLQIYLAIARCILTSHKAIHARLDFAAPSSVSKEQMDSVISAEKEYAEAMDHCLELLDKASS